MIELNEKDIKAVARSRFWTKYQWWFVGFLVLLVIAVFASSILINFVWAPILSIVVLFTTGFIWMYKAQSRYEKKLVESWKEQTMFDQAAQKVALRHND